MRAMLLKYKEMEVKSRSVEGHAFKCFGCGEVVEVNSYNEDMEGVEVFGMHGYATETRGLFYCNACAFPVEYHDDRREVRVGTHENVTPLRLGDFSLELEMVSRDENGRKRSFRNAILFDEDFCTCHFTAINLGRKYGTEKKSSQGERDCTVSVENHARCANAIGLAKWFYSRTEGEMSKMRDEEAGCHIHANCNYHFSDAVWHDIWNPVFQKMKFSNGDTNARGYYIPDEEKMKEYWGRTFSTYCTMEKGYHGMAISWHTGHNTVELRLTHVDTADQIIRAIKFWRACVNVVNKWGFKVQSGAWTPTRLGDKIVKTCFEPLVNGTKFYKGY